MAASNVNLDTLHLVIPTTGPQVYVNAQGEAIDLEVTDDNPEPVENLNPNEVFLSQPQSGPPQLVLPDGTAPNMDAAVITPYSQVTPPGVIRVG